MAQKKQKNIQYFFLYLPNVPFLAQIKKVPWDQNFSNFFFAKFSAHHADSEYSSESV